MVSAVNGSRSLNEIDPGMPGLGSQGADGWSLLKPSVFDYSISEICTLEEALKQIKAQEGKEGENYRRFKAEVDKVREANFPFRSYRNWKQSAVFSEYSSKIKKNRESKKSELMQRAAPEEMQKKLSLLSRLTFLHGSNSAALAMMALQKEPQLQCTGELMARGIAPMSGELMNGLLEKGINQRAVSVETVRDVGRVAHYSSSFPFSPDRAFGYLHMPCLSEVGDFLFVERLQSWRQEDPEGFAAILSPGMPKTLELIEAINKQQEFLEDDCLESCRKQGMPRHPRHEHDVEWKAKVGGDVERMNEKRAKLTQLMQMLEGTQEWKRCAWFCGYAQLKDVVMNPYSSKNWGQEYYWNQHVLRVTQMKQWDFSFFQKSVVPHVDEWMEAIGKGKRSQERPLKLFLAMSDYDFTEEEKTFLRAYRARNDSMQDVKEPMPMPVSLLSLFSSAEEIPEGNGNFTYEQVKREMKNYRNTNNRWEPLLSRVIILKLDEKFPETQIDGVTGKEHLDRLRPLFEAELAEIERGYQRIRGVLSDRNPPSIPIPEDEEFRSLITKPFPVIFASSVVKPAPISQAYVSEYVLRQAVPLGAEGCNILFTDTFESQEKIRRLLPQLQGIELHLISELDVGDFPLCTAPSQVEH